MLLLPVIAVAVATMLGFTGADARFRLKAVQRTGTIETRSCSTNADCLQKGLPIHPPVSRRRLSGLSSLSGRQVSSTMGIMDSTCGILKNITIAPGTYDYELHGAQGGGGRSTAGGLGGVITGSFVTATMVELQYFVGCHAGTDSNGGGGGGGGTFFFPQGNQQLALIVAGGGGGGGFINQYAGRPASTSNGVATQPYSSTEPAAADGSGGSNGNDPNAGGGGGGYKTAGSPKVPNAGQGAGGSQSTSYGGTFAGGPACSTCLGSGGAGGGGAGSSYAGGGGGGYSGGGGGLTNSRAGGGGASYAPQTGTVIAGVRFLTTPAITATNSGDGSISIMPSTGG